MTPTHPIIERGLNLLTKLSIGSNKTNLTIGGNVTEFDKITPETYEKMNEEFEEEGTPFKIKVPTQEEINDWKERSRGK